MRQQGVVRGLRHLASRLEVIYGLQPEMQAFKATSALAAPQAPLQRRRYAEAVSTEQTQMPELAFHKISDITLDDLFERVEEWVDNLDLDDTDIEYSQGVLTLKLGELGTYVINKQTPNRQIWMSSPVSGPVRYDYYKGSWIYKRDGHKMHERLQTELEGLTGQGIDLNPCTTCAKLNACINGTYCLT